MEKLIKKHLRINTPQWIIENCKALLTEWDSQKVYANKKQSTTPNIIKSVYECCNGKGFIDKTDGFDYGAVDCPICS